MLDSTVPRSQKEQTPVRWATHGEVDAIVRLFPSYRDFVDAALFAPGYGYYSSGTVRFGGGGHYDTYPLALSPLFGRMLAEYAYRRWRTEKRPRFIRNL